MKIVSFNLKIDVEVHEGEPADDVFHWLVNRIYDGVPDIANVEEIETE